MEDEGRMRLGKSQFQTLVAMLSSEPQLVAIVWDRLLSGGCRIGQDEHALLRGAPCQKTGMSRAPVHLCETEGDGHFRDGGSAVVVRAG